MSVEVRLPTLLRPNAGGAAVLSADGSTVGEVFQALIAEHPGLASNLVDGDGQLHKFVNVYRNDDDIRYLDLLDTKVADGDVISILPAVAGG
jgi:molybdopterin converting factor small subunit